MIKNVGPIRFDSNGTADLGPTICTQKADRFKSAPHLPKTYLSGGFLESMSGVLNLLILLNAKNAKNAGFAQVRYTAGTRRRYDIRSGNRMAAFILSERPTQTGESLVYHATVDELRVFTSPPELNLT